MFSSLWCGLFLAEGKYDAVIVTSPPLFIGFSGYLVSRWKRAPLIFEVRDLWPESAIDTGVLRNKLIIKIAYAFERFVYKKARLINVLTPAFLANLRDVKKVPEGKLLMIPNASDFSLSEEVMREFNRVQFRNEHDLDNYFVITYVGAHGVANHLEQVIYAAETLKDTNALFVLIGQGMEKERLRALASEKKLKNIRFFDAVPKREVFKFILASDMGLSVLKKVDTFKTVYSNKTFDYMSCKRPILMAIDGVSRQLVEEAKAGSYIEPENIMEYNTVIRNYLNNPSRAIAEGKNGYLFARSNFDRQILSEKYLDRINKVIK
jgi:glycosyltransferase involved in cell wall biosynthesis